MKSCVFYLSRTGNTKRLAQAIAEKLNAQIFDITNFDPVLVANFDLLVIGTPVMGLGPAPEVSSFIKKLPDGTGKEVIVFCTFAFAKGGVLKTLEKELSARNYKPILSVGKRGIKPDKSDFNDVLNEIKKVVKL